MCNVSIQLNLRNIWKKCKKVLSFLNNIYFFDMIQDKIKSRTFLPFFTIFIIYNLFNYIFSLDPKGEPFPSSINVMINPLDFLELGENARTFVIQITDQYSNPMENIEVLLGIVDLKINSENEERFCDFSYLSLNFWNFNFFRSLAPCTIEYEGFNISTDKNGFAFFSNFQFTQAPSGNYVIYFYLHQNNLKTHYYNILLAPNVFGIEILNNAPINAELHISLIPQPKAILYDKFHNPLFNQTLIAISWPFGNNNLKIPQLYDPDADKFALLNGIYSIPSNQKGYAEFRNLTIIGSTHQNVYILFTVM